LRNTSWHPRTSRLGPTGSDPGHSAARLVWVDGELLPAESPALSLLDRGLRDGEGLFETLRVYGRRPFLWQRHMERLVLSSAELKFPVMPSPQRLEGALAEVLAAMRLEDAAARITITRGRSGLRPGRVGVWVEAEPIGGRLWSHARPPEARAMFSRRRFALGPLGRHKTTSRLAYHLARDEAREARADEAILVGEAGEVLEGATSSVLARIGSEIHTPPLSMGILPGITRALTLELCRDLDVPVRERRLTPADLLHADEVMLANSIQEIVPVASLEGRAIPERRSAHALLEAYQAAVARAVR